MRRDQDRLFEEDLPGLDEDIDSALASGNLDRLYRRVPPLVARFLAFLEGLGLEDRRGVRLGQGENG